MLLPCQCRYDHCHATLEIGDEWLRIDAGVPDVVETCWLSPSVTSYILRKVEVALAEKSVAVGAEKFRAEPYKGVHTFDHLGNSITLSAGTIYIRSDRGTELRIEVDSFAYAAIQEALAAHGASVKEWRK